MQIERMQHRKEAISTEAEIFELHVSHTGAAPGSIPLSTFTKLTEKFSKLSKAIKDKLLLSDTADFAKEDKSASNLILYPGAAGSFRIFLGAPHPIRPPISRQHSPSRIRPGLPHESLPHQPSIPPVYIRKLRICHGKQQQKHTPKRPRIL